MSFGCRSAWLLSLLASVATTAAAHARELRICNDPNNLPFSNSRLEGFENKIVEVIGRHLHANVQYTWWAERRGFIRNTMQAGLCDLIPGTVSGIGAVRTTVPYYRSTYVFVTRSEAGVIASLDDPLLRQLRIGVHLIGDDGFNVPPAHALARRGITDNVRGFLIYGDYRQDNPPARLIEAVGTGEIDVALAWGPLAGYFAARRDPALRVTAVQPIRDEGFPMTFPIAMAVPRDNVSLRREIEGAIANHRAEIDAILAEYDVPRVDAFSQYARPLQ
jgi:mxaJ protein